MKKRKGFTMVELLAVILILGILFAVAVPAVSRWIDRSKKESIESQKQTLLMAGQSYTQGNSNALPKNIGETVSIKASELKDAHYLDEDIRNGDKKSCMENSYVKIYKYSKTGYTYTAFIYCDGDTVPAEDDDLPKPVIDITFTDDQGNDDFSKNVSITRLNIIVNGSEGVNPPLGIDGYSYVISVKYAGEDNYVEIYNSGSLNGGGRESLIIEKSLRDYVDIRKASDFSVAVKAYNRAGGHIEVTKTAIYHDDKGPSCGTITGEAGEDEWDKNLRSRTISITCSDGDGAGCVKDTYTKTFDTEMKDGFIEISDNAGNTTSCSVRVHLDWTTPTITVTAYARNSDGSKGAQAGQVVADNTNNSVSLERYTNDHNGWLSIKDYPYGLLYEITASDNVILNQGKWSKNEKKLWSGDEVYSLVLFKTNNLSNDENVVQYSLVEEGIRKAKYVLNDRANNKVTINITALIDRTKPTCTAGKSHLDTEDGVTVDLTCNDVGSGCSSTNTLTHKNIKKDDEFSVYDVAGNENTCGISVSSYSCHPYQYVCGSYQCGQHDCNCVQCRTADLALNDKDGGLVNVICLTCAKCPTYCNSYCTGYKTCYH